jgi:transcription initiation factor TFIIB
MKIASKKMKCPNCGSSRLALYGDKTACSNCSLVIDQNITKNRLRKPRKQNSIQICNQNPTFRMDPCENSLAKWQKLLRVSDSTEESLATVLFEITRIGRCISLSEDTLKLSLSVYKSIIQANLTKRTPTKVLAATIVYISCRQTGTARSLNEIAHLSKISAKIMRHTYNMLIKQLSSIYRPTMPNIYVRKLSTDIFKQEKTIELAEKITQCLKDQKLFQGKNPVGLAASACYLASILTGERKTQREIAELARVTEATMRTRYKEISRQLLFKVSL